MFYRKWSSDPWVGKLLKIQIPEAHTGAIELESQAVIHILKKLL